MQRRKRRRKKVCGSHKRIKINNVWWRWDEEVEMLKDDRGNVKKIQRGEERWRVRR